MDDQTIRLLICYRNMVENGFGGIYYGVKFKKEKREELWSTITEITAHLFFICYVYEGEDYVGVWVESEDNMKSLLEATKKEGLGEGERVLEATRVEGLGEAACV